MSTNGINGTPQPFPAVTEPKPKRSRKRKPSGTAREWELWLDDGTIGHFTCDENEARKRLSEVPMPWRERCELREVKR